MPFHNCDLWSSGQSRSVLFLLHPIKIVGLLKNVTFALFPVADLIKGSCAKFSVHTHISFLPAYKIRHKWCDPPPPPQAITVIKMLFLVLFVNFYCSKIQLISILKFVYDQLIPYRSFYWPVTFFFPFCC